jgi:flagellar biosynthesis/type III secretory pathway chaperone
LKVLSADQVKALTERLIALFAALQEALINERSALQGDDAQGLQAAVDAKQATLNAIHEVAPGLRLDELGTLIAGLSPAERKETEPRHNLLVQQAAAAKEYNAVNGKIVRRSQQSVQGVLSLMTGTDDALTYSERGDTQRTTGASAYAKA